METMPFVGGWVLQILRLWRENLLWFMGWNTFLALVPLALSLFLIGQRQFRSLKLLAAIALVLFLPNAPYVLTDVIHLWESLEESTRPGRLLLALLPQYLIYWLIGLAAYTLAVLNLRRWLKQQWSVLDRYDPTWTLHSLSGLGVYLGRFDRFNSWDILHTPRLIVESAIARLFSAESLLWVIGFTLMTALGYSALKSLRSLLERHFSLRLQR